MSLSSGTASPLIATVESLSTDGRGIVRIEGKAVFVESALPGDRVQLELLPGSKPPAARVLEILTASPFRCPHVCPHADVCSGSPWGALDYSQQLAHKQELVRRTLHKAVGDIAVLPVVPGPAPWHYRNRIRLHVWTDANRVQLGFQTEARQARGVAVHTCALAHGAVDAALQKLSAALSDTSAARLRPAPLSIQLHQTASGAGALLVFRAAEHQAGLHAWSEFLAPLLSGGGWYAAGNSVGIIDFRQEILSDPDAGLMRTMSLDQPIDIHPAAFTQANHHAAAWVGRRLSRLAAEWQPPVCWDLYGGFGALSLAVTGAVPRVFELSPFCEAVFDRLNVELRDSSGTFVRGDLLRTFPRWAGRISARDLVILDPPRSGVHPELIRLIASSPARRIAYLSCNAARLARDLVPLIESGFVPSEIQPVDFFPQTPSIETLCLLQRS